MRSARVMLRFYLSRWLNVNSKDLTPSLLTPSLFASILGRVKQDQAFWQIVEPLHQALTKAEEIVVAHNVRTLDAGHLASAIVIQDSIGAPLPFITADERQLTAARDCKLETIAV